MIKNDDFSNESNRIEIIPYNDNQDVSNFNLSQDYLVVNIKTNVVNKIIVY
jgi:hypothetical protein